MGAWYLRRKDELLIDIDRAFQPVHDSGHTRIEQFFRRRLRDAERDALFLIRKVVLEPSYTDGNVHAFVQLDKPLTDLEGLIWQSWLGSDLYRSRTDLMRFARRHMFPSLLIAPNKSAAWRDPDAICGCTRKHDTVELHEHPDRACKVWMKYRGPTPWECFGEPSTEPGDGSIAGDLPFGSPVPLHLIRMV